MTISAAAAIPLVGDLLKAAIPVVGEVVKAVAPLLQPFADALGKKIGGESQKVESSESISFAPQTSIASKTIIFPK
ncbi:hypothetical protein CQ048_19565 [Pseudomonas trivialis]|nr:hypothetical protein CQ048_19565 [Pseudomonas trivialis]PRB24707.1 hypothetical protein CQ041_18705 [Pseudomonas sp. MYb60]